MRRPSEPPALPAVSDVLGALSDTVAGVEDDLLASLVVMGEADAQRTVDGWVDQVVDLLRAVDEVAVQHRATLARAHARQPGVVDGHTSVGDVGTATALGPAATEQP
ncbi:hypothetical protein GCM10022415_02770 [Knoellia locipacati]|uniref:Uncharacterized protein n=1 Tax=Knoellia locipacati TaxID=882824 RepID=A0A512SW99_9MICO|nr:hypothetical protein [Knoellia locipacati]GEQ12229.1 hypothetical protein KLO01_02760 [Knoellia locipacati]